MAQCLTLSFQLLSSRTGFNDDLCSYKTSYQTVQEQVSCPSIYHVFVAQDSSTGLIVGYNALAREALETYSVGPLGVHPHYQKHGVGRRLMVALSNKISFLDEPPLPVSLVVNSYNPQAISLYTSLGFDVQNTFALVCGKIDSGATRCE
eukprot:TRINITY_DN3923_c0_g1_i1.p1 TRINITY_DN3923_c0_g1~~TRINITY_DN3923_c0_g1_i1.p1  ORF type:complete len:172 (-),score=30.03 TRINITY_DN3923_c0_g1_i1:159-605(-)